MKGITTMRFMMFMIPNVREEDWMPSAEAVAAMSKYNESLTKAGVLLSLDGLQPPAKGARVSFSGGKPRIIDGPFTGAKELIGGYPLNLGDETGKPLDGANKYMLHFDKASVP